MSVIWMVVSFLSGAWLVLLPVRASATVAASVLLVCGVASSFFGCARFRIREIDRRWYFFALPLVAGLLVIPFPLNVGLIMAVLATALLPFCPGRNRLTAVTLGLLLCGLVMMVQATLVPLYALFATLHHRVGLLSPVLLLVLRLVGIRSAAHNGSLFVSDESQVYQLPISWENLGLFLVANLLVAGVLVLLIAYGDWRKYLRFVVVVAVFSIVRYALLIGLFLRYPQMKLFWDPTITVLSFLPLGLILVKVIPLSTRAVSELRVPRLSRERLSGNHVALMLYSAIAVFLFTAFAGLHESGKRKEGRILLDTGHSDWEWVSEPYTTDRYSMRSGYNYYCMVDYLSHYYHVNTTSDSLTIHNLAPYDVLIIKTPTRAFSPSEIEAIRQFVVDGGGLLLIGDHTNVFGMATHLNPIAKEFGFRFGCDATYDLSTGHLSLYRPPRILPHPIVQHVRAFLFATSCTLVQPMWAHRVIIGYGLRAVGADYSQRNFFPAAPWNDNTMEYGLFVQGGAARVGKGRVALFTDSTVFSNFWMFMPGKPELLLGYVEWLNRSAGRSITRTLFLAAGVLMIGLALYLLVPRHVNNAINILTFCPESSTIYPWDEDYTFRS